MTLPLVVDASVAIKWVAEEPYAEAAASLIDKNIHAPDWLIIECASALWKKTQQKLLSVDAAEELLSRIHRVQLSFHPAADHVDAAFSLATELQHSVYDCMYLQLALRLKGICITDDRKFFLAASAKKKYKNHMALLAEYNVNSYH